MKFTVGNETGRSPSLRTLCLSNSLESGRIVASRYSISSVMDLQSYLRNVLSSSSLPTIDLTGAHPTVRPRPEVIDLTASPEPPLSQHMQAFLSLVDWEPARSLKRGATRKTINSLGCWKVRKLPGGLLVIRENQRVPPSCAICLEEFHEAAVVRSLPCRHIYHKNCIDQWLCHNPRCPLDRRALQ